MKVNGNPTRQMASASSGTQTETSTKVVGRMIKRADMELTSMLMELATKDSGKTT